MLVKRIDLFTLMKCMVAMIIQFTNKGGQCLLMCNSQYLALINRARGLYGGILTEVVSTDRTQ